MYNTFETFQTNITVWSSNKPRNDAWSDISKENHITVRRSLTTPENYPRPLSSSFLHRLR